MSETREVYITTEWNDKLVGLAIEGPGGDLFGTVGQLNGILDTANDLWECERMIKERWPGRPYWIEWPAYGGTYQLVEYGAFAGKAHKQ